jgi:hypothetical protein
MNSISASTPSARSMSIRPLAVSVTRWPERSSRAAPISRSSTWIWRLSEGWVMFRLSAAARMLSERATAAK